MNEDPEVMRYFPKPWTAEESRAAFQWINASFDERGFGIYAVEPTSGDWLIRGSVYGSDIVSHARKISYDIGSPVR
jgi:RimJ/RimL family protein N-acetyltransferase